MSDSSRFFFSLIFQLLFGYSLLAVEVLPDVIHLDRFPANQAQEAIVTLRNPSDSPVSIGTVRASCGCLTAKLSTREILAHGQTSMTVQIPAEGISGAFTQMVFMEFGDEVRAVRITGEAIPLVEVGPQRILNVGTLTASQPCRQKFLLTATEPVEFGEAEVVGAEARLERQSDNRWSVSVTFTPEDTATLFRRTILLPVLSPPGWKPVKIVVHGRMLSQTGVNP